VEPRSRASGHLSRAMPMISTEGRDLKRLETRFLPALEMTWVEMSWVEMTAAKHSQLRAVGQQHRRDHPWLYPRRVEPPALNGADRPGCLAELGGIPDRQRSATHDGLSQPRIRLQQRSSDGACSCRRSTAACALSGRACAFLGTQGSRRAAGAPGTSSRIRTRAPSNVVKKLTCEPRRWTS